MDARETILQSVRKCQPPRVDLPTADVAAITYDDPKAQFEEVLAAVGGSAVTVRSPEEIATELQKLEPWSKAKKRFSALPHIPEAKVSPEDAKISRHLQDLEFAIVPAEFGVAENAAVWVTDKAAGHRLVYFITQHLALVLPVHAIVHNMHQAYQRLGAIPKRDYTIDRVSVSGVRQLDR